MELVLKEVCKNYDQKEVLANASFCFEKGKIYGLLGRNGVGKTTLFDCISRRTEITGGEIFLETNGDKNTEYKDTDIGYVYATPHLPAFMTGFEFVKFFIDVNKDRIQHPLSPEIYLQQVGIQAEDQHRLLKDYSHGMQNKVQMLVTMIVKPAVLLLDEPLTSFDVVAAHEMKELILQMRKDSIIIFSTHILQLAQDLCDEIVLLNQRQLHMVDPAVIHTKDFEEEVIELLTEEQKLSERIEDNVL